MRACGAGAGAGPAQGLDFGPTVLIWGLLLGSIVFQEFCRAHHCFPEAREAHICPGSHSLVACPFSQESLETS